MVNQIQSAYEILKQVSPQSLAPGSANGTAVDMTGRRGIAFLVHVGAVSAGGTVDAKVQQDTVSAFSSPTDVTGAAITQLADTDDDVLMLVTVEPGTYTEQFLRVVITTTTAAGLVSSVALALCDGIVPVANSDLKEIVAV